MQRAAKSLGGLTHLAALSWEIWRRSRLLAWPCVPHGMDAVGAVLRPPDFREGVRPAGGQDNARAGRRPPWPRSAARVDRRPFCRSRRHRPPAGRPGIFAAPDPTPRQTATARRPHKETTSWQALHSLGWAMGGPMALNLLRAGHTPFLTCPPARCKPWSMPGARRRQPPPPPWRQQTAVIYAAGQPARQGAVPGRKRRAINARPARC